MDTPLNTAPTPPSTDTRPRKPPWGWIGAVVVFAAVALAILKPRRPRPPGPPGSPGAASVGMVSSAPRPITPAQRALFAPLTEGSQLGPATVVGFEGMGNGGTLSVNVHIGQVTQTFRVARTARVTSAMHLRATGPYTVYLVGSGSESSRAAIEQTWRALEAVIATHTNLPVPEGMQPCCPFNGSKAG